MGFIQINSHLQRAVLYLGAVSSLLLIVAYGLLRHTLPSVEVIKWFIGSILILVYVLALLWKNLDLNRPVDGAHIQTNLGLATQITMLRGFFFAGIAGFILLPTGSGPILWMPGILYITAALLDAVDGFVARKTNFVTRLGTLLDEKLDALGILVATGLGVTSGKLPLWYMAMGAAYYLYRIGQQWREANEKPVYDLPPDRTRSIFAGIQMGFLGVVLLPVYQPEITNTVSWAFFLPGALLFIRDWLMTSGVIAPDSNWYMQIFRTITTYSARWILPVVRIIIFLFIAIHLTHNAVRLTGSPQSVYLLLLGLSGLMVLLGILGRLGGLGALLLAGMVIQISHASLILWFIGYGGVIILFFGVGKFALWRGDDWLLYGKSPEGDTD